MEKFISFSSREDALKRKLEVLKKKQKKINATFCPEFENLSGSVAK